MSLVVLFRFHDHYDLTLHNLGLIRSFNPNISFIGFYGGNENIDNLPSQVRNAFDGVYKIPSEDPYWKWKNADLCVRQWFKDVGHQLKFDHVHLGEWDMLTLVNLQEHAPKPNQNSMTYQFNYHHAVEIGWDWIQSDYEEWNLIKNQFQKQFGFKDFENCDFGIMGGAFLSRQFLKKYSEIYPPSYNNDEVRIGLYSKLWNIDVVDNGFKALGGPYRTADDREYSQFTKKHLMDGVSKGYKILHPVREKLVINT